VQTAISREGLNSRRDSDATAPVEYVESARDGVIDDGLMFVDARLTDTSLSKACVRAAKCRSL